LQQVGTSPRVLNLIGVGGIGKSRLLRELKDRCSSTHRTATLDLQVPAMRQQEDALAVVRVELGRQGVKFDRFDIAYAVLWQRLHPHLRLSRSELPFVSESEALTQILDGAAGLPVFGTGVGLVKLVEKATTGARRRRRIKVDETLHSLDELTNVELADAVTYLFAEDLREASAEKPFVLFIDAYEALVPTRLRSGRAAGSDVWLRDLVAQLDRGLTVVASRERLGWDVHDEAWNELVHERRVDGLPMEARLDLLTEGGVTDHAARHAIAVASQGLPFYLHLAVDTRTTARQRAVVSSEEILHRFINHVAEEEIRTLELLSVARVFDFEIFQAVADAFDLPRHRMAWESLTVYSFVYPAGAHGNRLHQLMRGALHQRLSEPAIREVQTILRAVWDARARQEHETEDGLATRSRAIREAAFCGLYSGALTGAGVLGYADQALAYGGKQALDGMLRDLQEYVDARPEASDLVKAARCLEAETAIVLGDAATAVDLTPAIERDLNDTIGARLAIAGAHGRRIAGDTAKAIETFTAVWNNHSGPVRHRAGFCVADLDMSQGRFRDAFNFTERLLDEAPTGDFLLRGDIARLQHLGYRFALDFVASQRALDEASELYRRAGTIVEPANLVTNRSELLAWTDPLQAVNTAADAIEVQSELGAFHELGKAYTALAIAQTRLGQHDEATVSFQTATEALDRARYRSGRARAELFRAYLYARTGDVDAALASARWAVQELLVAEVYPSLIMMTGQFLETIGIADPEITEAAHRASRQIQPLDSLSALRERTGRLVVDLLED
jgi:tetratricopeptide (TPR) repeat protein